ncbi:helix-turn-helix domain-containing protein [Streptomyces sp. PmtG]
MLTLGTLVGEPELELAFAEGTSPATYGAVPVTALMILSLEQLVEGLPQRHLEPGSLVLVTGMPSQIRGRAEIALETLLEQLSLDGCVGLAVAPTGAHPTFPQVIRELSQGYALPLLVTTAPLSRWDAAHERLQEGRVAVAERQAVRLDALISTLPTQFADARAAQRIVDGLAQGLDAQVLVSEADRVLVASPPDAVEYLERAIIHGALETTGPEGVTAPHTRFLPLPTSSGTDAVLAAARPVPFGESDIRLLRHAAKLLGLLDQGRREYGVARAACEAAKAAALELLVDAEVAKARRVMAPLAPGLLEGETIRVYVLGAAPARRDAVAERCEAVLAHRALVVADPGDEGRVLVIRPAEPDRGDGDVAAELTRVVASLGPGASLGGSGDYSIALLADALREACVAQGFARHQPGAVVLSARRADLITLLPPLEARRWARHVLQPLLQAEESWKETRERLLGLDFDGAASRAAVCLALDLMTRHGAAEEPEEASEAPPTLLSLLSAPQVAPWADALLAPARKDRRDLLGTAASWLAHNACVESTARALKVTVVTVRSHLQALESSTDRDLTDLPERAA